jgi:N-methylhydantoinase A
VRVAVPDGALDRAALDDVTAAFHAEHRGLYGYDFAGDPSQQVEWVNLRVSGIGPITRPEIRRRSDGFETVAERPPQPTGEQGPVVDEGAPTPVSKPPVTRPVCFEAEQGYVDTPVRWRGDLAPGATVTGPAIIEEYGSTVPLHPGFTATVDDFGNLLVRRAGA